MRSVLTLCLVIPLLYGVPSLKIKAVLKPCGTQKGIHHTDDVLSKCGNQLDVTMKIVTSAEDQGFSHFIKVESAFDEKTDEEVKLLHPLLIKVENRPTALVYPLTFLKTVNNRAYETFLHKDNVENYGGCLDFTTFSYCAERDENDAQIPFSEGFCCPCHGNTQRYHVRGGQDCAKKQTPLGQDIEAYHSSVHCLRFDQVWYSVNKLGEPYLHHEVIVHIFKESSVKNGSKWMSVSNGQDLILGNHNAHVTTGQGQVIVDYISSMHDPLDPLHYKDNVLLIPEPNPEINQSELPLQMRGNASEFLVIDKDQVRVKGDKCDMIGVSFEAFYQQNNRCYKPAQSCLGNQPMDYWLHDVEKRLLGKDPDFFLSGRAIASSTPVMKTSDGRWHLFLKYPETHIAHLHIRLNADPLQPLLKCTDVYILEVTSGRGGDHDILAAHVYNPSPTTANVTVAVKACNITIKGKLTKNVTIGPKQSNVVLFSLSSRTVDQTLSCKVTVHDEQGSALAERDVKFVQGHRCYCLVNCDCACGYHYTCSPVNGSRYPFPVRTWEEEEDRMFTDTEDPIFLVIVTGLALLFIGFMKAALGLCDPAGIGQMGLCYFTAGKTIDMYYEKELWGVPVLYDENHTPVHPKTRQPVQVLSTCRLVLLNLVIGFYIPLIWLHSLVLCCKGKNRELDEPAPKILMYEEFKMSRADQSHLRKDLYMADYRRHRKEMKQGSRSDTETYLNDNLPVLYPGDIPVPCHSSPVLCQVPVEKTQSPEGQYQTGSTVTVGRKPSQVVHHQNTIKELLQASKVYYNFTEESKCLRNSGEVFSLCGWFTKEGRKYKFDIGDYSLQTFENRGGPRKLAQPKPIPFPEQYAIYMRSGQVHRVISLEPVFPCLNDK